MVDVSNWKEFRVGNLFELKGVKQAKSQQMIPDATTESGLPYVVQSRYNNMVSRYVDETYLIEHNEPIIDGNAIVLGVTLNACSYQKDRFGASQVITARSRQLNEFNGFFIATILRKYVERFDYKEKPGLEKYKNLIIKLPATTDGWPDWGYMESYMKTIMEESEKSFENLKRADDTKHLIDVSGWGEFRVGDLFDKLTLKCRKSDFNKVVDCSEIQTEEFSLPLTNAKHFNNGIQFYGRPDEWDSAEMTIDIVSNGAIATGDVYAQPQKTGVLWDSYLVKCKYDIESEFVLQYMACVIQRCIKQYFGWDDKCTWDKVKEQTLQLPIDANGEPDWRYMEDYMKGRLNEAELAVSQLQLVA